VLLRRKALTPTLSALLLIAITVSAGAAIYVVYEQMIAKTQGIIVQLEGMEAVKVPSSTLILMKIRNVGERDLASAAITVYGDNGTSTTMDVGSLSVGAVRQVTFLNPEGLRITPGKTYPIKVKVTATNGGTVEKAWYVKCEGVMGGEPEGEGGTIFDLSVTPNMMIVEAGSSGTACVDVKAVGGYVKVVELTAVDVPSDLTVSLNPTSGAPTFTSTLTVEAAAGAKGTYTFMIRARGSDGLTKEQTVTVRIPLNPPDNPPGDISFNITVQPNPLTVDAGGTAAALVNVGGKEGVNVELTVSNVPSTLQLSLDPWTGTVPFKSVLTVKVAAAAEGSYTFRVDGIDDEGNANSCAVIISVSGSSSDDEASKEKAKNIALNDSRVQEKISGKEYEMIYGSMVALSASLEPADITLSFNFTDSSPPLIVTVDLDGERVVDILQLPAKAGQAGSTEGPPGQGFGMFWSGIVNNVGDYKLVYISVANTSRSLKIGLLWSNSYNDIDLFLYNPNRQLAAQSTAAGTLSEGLCVNNPAAGTWILLVYGYNITTPQGYYGAVEIIQGE